MSLQNSRQISDVKVMLKTGVDGIGIASIEKTSTQGLVDTYTITYDDGTKTTFDVTNGSGISSIAKTGTSGVVDTYTITFDNGNTFTFTVTNGSSIADIQKTGTVGLVDTYTITLTNGETYTFEVTNGSGNSGSKINFVTFLNRLFNTTLTLKKGNTVLSEQQIDSTGHATFRNIEETGTLTLVGQFAERGYTYELERDFATPYYGSYDDDFNIPVTITSNSDALVQAYLSRKQSSPSDPGYMAQIKNADLSSPLVLNAVEPASYRLICSLIQWDESQQEYVTYYTICQEDFELESYSDTYSKEIKLGVINVTFADDSYIGSLLVVGGSDEYWQRINSRTEKVYVKSASTYTLRAAVAGAPTITVTVADLDTPVSVNYPS